MDVELVRGVDCMLGRMAHERPNWPYGLCEQGVYKHYGRVKGELTGPSK